MPGTRVLCDSFDWRLYKENRCLEASTDADGRVHLVLTDLATGARLGDARLTDFSRFPRNYPPSTLRRLLLKTLDERALLPRAIVDGYRWELQIRDEQEKITGRIELHTNTLIDKNGRKIARLSSRLTLRPVKGYEREFEPVAGLVAAIPGLEPASASLVEEACLAAGHQPGDYSAKIKLQLDPAEPAERVCRRMLQHYLHVMRSNEAGVLAEIDTEYLHDFRVALRSTRAMLDLVPVFADPVVQKYEAGFSWLGKVTGPKRDIDVLILKMDDYLHLLPRARRRLLAPLMPLLQETNAAHHRTVTAALHGQRYRSLLNAWKTFLSDSHEGGSAVFAGNVNIETVARHVIARATGKVSKRARAITHDAPLSAVHRFRISCKKLRYLLEFFQGLYPPDEMRSLIREMKTVQDNLGDFNDLGVHVAMLQGFAGKLTGNTEAASAAVELTTALAVEQERSRRSLYSGILRLRRLIDRREYQRVLTQCQS